MVIDLEMVDSRDNIALLMGSPLGLGLGWVPTDPIHLETMGDSRLLLALNGSGDPKGQGSHRSERITISRFQRYLLELFDFGS